MPTQGIWYRIVHKGNEWRLTPKDVELGKFVIAEIKKGTPWTTFTKLHTQADLRQSIPKSQERRYFIQKTIFYLLWRGRIRTKWRNGCLLISWRK